jgi:phosphoribosylanthranilate isomerase
LGLATVQLNGHENPELVSKLRPLRVLKAVRVDPATIEGELATWRDANLPNLDGIVLEPANTGQAGGTGIANDWATVRQQIDKGTFGPLPLIAAGGLTPQTVGDVVRQLRPWAVDVASGVEETKGIKSRAKIEAFIDAVRQADRSL